MKKQIADFKAMTKADLYGEVFNLIAYGGRKGKLDNYHIILDHYIVEGMQGQTIRVDTVATCNKCNDTFCDHVVTAVEDQLIINLYNALQGTD